jgi:uncharacterized RDD family membrane protein YckC
MDPQNQSVPTPPVIPQMPQVTVVTQPTQQQPVVGTQAPVSIRYAGLGRIAASFLDGIVIFTIIGVILYFLYYPGDVDKTTSEFIIGLVSMIYSIFFVAIWGATPGKKLLKMKIVDKNYNKPKFWQIILRESFGKIVTGMLLLISVLLVLFHKQKRSIHDFIAGTYVVYK